MRLLSPMLIFLLVLSGFMLLLGYRPIPVPSPSVSIAQSLNLSPKVVLPRIIELRRITAYNPLPSQTDTTPTLASCGPNRPHQIALSQDLFFFEGHKLCGQKVSVYDQHGNLLAQGVVWDTMNPRYKKAADIFLNTTNTASAVKFGVKTGYLVF